MRLWLATFVALALSACQPGDQKVKTVKERLEAGELVEFTKPGWRTKACSDRSADWVDLRITQNNARENIVLGKIKSGLNPGMYNCFRIGSVVRVGTGSTAAAVVITKLGWVHIDKLRNTSMKGEVYASSTEFEFFRNLIKSRMRADQLGIVTYVEFTYINGSAADQKAIEDEDQRQQQGDGYVETVNDGQSLSTCKTPWTDVFAEEEFFNDIKAGKLLSWYRMGDLNCLPQGGSAALRKNKDTPPVATLKIKKIKRFKVGFLDPKFFTFTPDFDFGRLNQSIANQNASRPQALMTVVDFEIVPSAPTSGLVTP